MSTDIFDDPLTDESSEKITSVEQIIDGWATRPSDEFEGFLEIVKTRKNGDSITVHINPVTGRVRKFAGDSSSNPKIEKESRLWGIALTVFELDEDVVTGSIRRLKSDPSRGYEDVLFLDMPYLGLSLKHYNNIAPEPLSQEAKETFAHRMEQLVDEGVFFPDMNSGNVLVSISNGKSVLVPIDWEAAQTRRVSINTDYYKMETRKRCDALFSQKGIKK